MGLSAGQARLLSITRRKSDCEFLSMSYSHQKLAISRELEMLSNNYTNSLNKTRLLYDFYGTNSEAGAQALSYNLLMTPNALNDYIPKLVTTNSGKVVLDSKYAAAARAAGIPPEGLATGSLPSQTVRDKFIQALEGQNVITTSQSEQIQSIAYNQALGLGAIDSISYSVATVPYSDLLEALTGTNYYIDLGEGNKAGCGVDGVKISNGTQHSYLSSSTVTLGDILNGDYVVTMKMIDNEDLVKLAGLDWDHEHNNLASAVKNFQKQYVKSMTCFADIVGTIDDLFSGTGAMEAALNYAKYNMGIDDTTLISDKWSSKSIARIKGISDSGNNIYNASIDEFKNTRDYWYNIQGSKNIPGSGSATGYNSGGAISVSAFAKTYMAYILSYFKGESAVDYNIYKYNQIDAELEKLTEGMDIPVAVESTANTSDKKVGGFYDTLFNMICTNGWTENANITDKDYLQNMIKSGAMYLSTENSDGYFYQENYASDTLIREEEDSSAVAEAEAKYNAQKLRLANKEDAIDLKMKNLDTELTALQTEYDSVKKTIDKNISNIFKRYS